jgi:hypothetical protein
MDTYLSSNAVGDLPFLASDDRWNLVLRIASSPHFAKATQPRDILLYITRQSIQEGSTSISELEIAQTVLHRRADFDPIDDSIVRVQISHIRKKLDLYFAGEGRNEAIRIIIPKGSYVPQFESISKPEAPPVKPSPTMQTAAPVPVDEPLAVRARWLNLRTLAVAELLLILLFATLWIDAKRKVESRPNVNLSAQYEQNPLLSRIFGSKVPVSIVLADADFSMLEDTLKLEIPVHEYMNKNYLSSLLAKINDPSRKDLLQALYNRRDTSLGQAGAAFKLGEIANQFGNDASIRFARYLNARDFEKGNFVLVGSRRGMPWAELFESQLNFSYEKDPTMDAPYFKNKHPEPGEQSEYPAIVGKESYTDIALVPNLGHNGYVLLVRGLSMESNETAAEFLFNPESSKMVPPLADPKQSIEIFLRNHITEGTPSGFEVVAVRKF